MASEEDHTVYGGEEDLDEDDDEEVSEEEDHDLTLTNHPDDDDDVDDEDDSLSSAAGEVTIAVAGVPAAAANSTAAAATSIVPLPTDLKRQRVDDAMIATAVVEEKKPMPLPLDESRRLFQRLWTDEDEIELLQGFLDYTAQRGPNSSSHHHDTTAFYDQIKNKLQLDFNKNQLVEKLRRLKKKYRNVLSKISSGKEYVFKSPHDQATFEISCKIWGNGGSGAAAAAGGVEGTGLDDEDANPNPYSNSTPIPTFTLNDHNNNGFDPNSSEKKVPRSRKRSRGGVKIEEKPLPTLNLQQPDQSVAASASASIPHLVEETVKSCLSPLFKELLNNAVNGPCASRGFGGMNLNPMPLGFGGSLNYSGGDVADEKWRKQHISELEVYSKRLELVQDEIKSQLEELRSMGS